MTFYSKLTQELKNQFKTSNILILETWAKCVVVAQHVQEGLHKSTSQKDLKEAVSSGSKYLKTNSPRDQIDQYYLGHCQHQDNHRHLDDHNKEAPRADPKLLIPTCFKYKKPGHYATICLDNKEPRKAKIQLI